MRNVFADIIKSPNKIAFGLTNLGLTKCMSDESYLKWVFKLSFGKKLDLNDPKTFNEKLQWLKLYDRNPKYTEMVDKYEVKKYIAEKIGDQYIIPTLGVWDKFDDIDFNSLPNQFVLKCTHDSGGLVICKDKSKFDKEAARKKIEKSLRSNFFRRGREWPYKDVKPRIIAEQYMSDGRDDLADYKIHNFNGVPKMVLVCRDRFKNSGLTEDFLTENWEHIDVRRPGHPNASEEIPKPEKLQEMLELSKVLSEGIPFVRTDFYEIDGRVYFGEITFYPASGFAGFEPEKYDCEFGDWISLPKKYQVNFTESKK